MSDITKCEGKGCVLKESCKRFLTKPSYMQSYFSHCPVQSGDCAYYIKCERENKKPSAIIVTEGKISVGML